MMEDRRQLIRWYINKETSLRLHGEERALPCVVEDINVKGLKIFTRQELAKQDNICLAVDFSRDFSLDVEAAVAWRRVLSGGYVYGLYFTRIKDADKERLYKFIVDCCAEQMKEHRWRVDIN